MATNYIQPGEVMDFVAGANVTTSVPVLIGLRLGVPLVTFASGATGSVQMTGVFEITKVTTDVMAQGALLYWDDTAKKLTTTSAGNTLAGYCFKAAGNGATKVHCKLNA